MKMPELETPNLRRIYTAVVVAIAIATWIMWLSSGRPFNVMFPLMPTLLALAFVITNRRALLNKP